MRQCLVRILKSLTICLSLLSCTTPVKSTKYDADFRWVDVGPGLDPLACTSEHKLMELREILIRCNQGQK